MSLNSKIKGNLNNVNQIYIQNKDYAIPAISIVALIIVFLVYMTHLKERDENKLTQESKKVVVKLDFNEDLILIKQPIPKLKIFYGNKEVHNLISCKLEIENISKEAIKVLDNKHMYEIESSTEILDIVNLSKHLIKIDTTTFKKVFISTDELNINEKIIFKLFFMQKSKFEFRNNTKTPLEIKNIKNYEK